MDFVTRMHAIFAGDDEFLEATDWHVFRLTAGINERVARKYHGDAEGPLMQALGFLHHRFEQDVLHDPEAAKGGPLGRQGRPPSSRVVRAYAARFARIADLLESQEAAIGVVS